MGFLRTLVSVVVVVIIVIFAWQNSHIVDVDFLVWHWEVSRALVIFISFGLGLVIGIIGARIH